MPFDRETQPKDTRPRWGQRALSRLRFAVPLLVVIAGTLWVLQPLREASALPAPPLPSYTPEPPDFQEMLVLGPTAFAPQTRGAVRVLIRDPRSGHPVPGVEVWISLNAVSQASAGEMLFRGETNDLGTVDAAFEVPAVEEGEWTMAIDAAGPVGEQHVARRVTIQRPLVLSARTPKRIYHPGEQVQVWIWAGGRIDRRPASGQPVAWTLLDARGNRICAEVIQISEYGVAQGRCTLADGAGEGPYRLVATLGEVTTESELWVESRVPGVLRVDVRSARGYLVVGQSMDAQVQATDAYGKPVANAAVEVEARLAPEGALLFRRAGETNGAGSYSLEAAGEDLLKLGLESGASVQLTAWVIDAEGHSGRGEAWVPVSEQEIEIAAWPESAVLEPGIENWIHVRARYPDGRAAQCELEAVVPGVEQAIQAETDAEGLARIPVTPDPASRLRISLRAVDDAGSTGSVRLDLPVADAAQHLLLRPEGAHYACGETMRIEALTAETVEAVYLDLRVGGQQVAAHAAPVEEGRARYEVPLPREWSGPVELDAYALLPDGTLLRDAREVWVECPAPLQVRARRLEDEPGSPAMARVAVETTSNGGTGAPALVTASLIRPGDEGEDRAQLVEQPVPRPVPAADLVPQYAETASKFRPISAAVLRSFESYREAWAERASAFAVASERFSWGAVGLFFLSWMVTLPCIWRRRRSPLPPLLGALLLGSLLIVAGVLGAHVGAISMGPGAVLALGLAWLGALLAALAQAWAEEESGWMPSAGAVAVAGGILAVGLHYATSHAVGADSSLSLGGWAGLGGVCLALSAFGLGRLRDGRPQHALTAFSLVLVLAATWGGTILAGWGPEGPAYQEPPPLRPRVDPPAPLPVEAPTTLLTVAGGDAPLSLPTAGGGELLQWVPSVETNEQGTALLEVPFAETPDGVRVRTFAVDKQGRWGSEDTVLAFAKPVWATVRLPAELTVGDQLDLPVTVHNALPVSSSVRISVTKGGWFTLRTASTATQEASLPPGGEHTFVLPIRVEAWGEQELGLSVQSATWSEAITRVVRVQPNGEWVAGAYSWWVEEETRYKFRIPWAAYEDTDRIAVRIYAGHQSVLSGALAYASEGTGSTLDQLVGGVEATLARVPYLQRVDGGSGSLRAELERRLTLDHQRLLAFEATRGGFGAVPGAPADLYRSAVALRCLSELASLLPVESEAVDRTAAWLLAQQATDGTWQLEHPPPSWAALPHAELPITAYVAWALLDAGYGESDGVEAAVQHLQQYLESAQDPYVLALVTNALLSTGEESDATVTALARLAEQAEVRYGTARWHSGLQTLSGAAGGEIEAGGYRTPSVKVEVTALATLALARGGSHPEEVEAGLAMLIDSRDVSGTWNAPSSTSLALRAFLAGLSEPPADPAEHPVSARVSVGVNDGEARALDLKGDASAEVVFEELEKGYNDIEIKVDGDRVAYQIAGSYCLRWSQVPPPLPEEEGLSVEVSYDRTSLLVGETITATAVAMLNRPGTAPLTLLELGLPPGLTVIEADLERLVADGVIARYERARERLRVYLVGLSNEKPVRLTYRLRAGFPLRVLTQPSYGVDIANPQRPAVRAPVAIEVR